MVLLNQSRFLERLVRSVFIDGLDSVGRECQSHVLFEFGNIDLLFLQIRILPNHSCRIKLGGTGAV